MKWEWTNDRYSKDLFRTIDGWPIGYVHRRGLAVVYKLPGKSFTREKYVEKWFPHMVRLNRWEEAKMWVEAVARLEGWT